MSLVNGLRLTGKTIIKNLHVNRTAFVPKRTILMENSKIKPIFNQKGINLLLEAPGKVAKWVNGFDTVITDCDGVLWVYSDLIEGALEAINSLQAAGKHVYFCTNNSTKTRHELYEKAVKMGFKITEQDIISTAHSTAAYLKGLKFEKKVYVIGSSGIARELDAVGIEHFGVGPDVMPCHLQEYVEKHFQPDPKVGAVIVGFDENFSFPKITHAATYLHKPDCLFLATNTDERFPMPNMIIPGTGSLVKAIQVCAERDPLVIGKPNPTICDFLIKNNTITPERTLMVGDRCNTDILLGYNCGFQTLLVGTGIHNLHHVHEWKKSNNSEDKKLIPDVFLPKLGDILSFLPPPEC